jgi:hypothetical protein
LAVSNRLSESTFVAPVSCIKPLSVNHLDSGLFVQSTFTSSTISRLRMKVRSRNCR